MATGPSQALSSFRESLRLAERLLSLEYRYKDPAPSDQRPEVEGLRGGAAVLMVAAFERFVKECIRERFEELRTRQPAVRFDRLPARIRVASVFTSLEQAMRHPPKDKADRLQHVTVAASDIAQGRVNSSAVANTGGNPNPETLQSLFRQCDIDDLFRVIKPRFESKWASPVAETFIKDTLTATLARRHEVAHSGDVSHVSRDDLRESLRFLRHLAVVLDDETRIRMNKVYRKASP